MLILRNATINVFHETDSCIVRKKDVIFSFTKITHKKILKMKHKTITIKASATIQTGTEFKEYEYPILNNYLDQGWKIKEIYQSTTNQNVGFIFLTFVLTIE